MAKGQQLLAEMFGYVESMGGEGIKRGQLVPFDHPTSPLNGQEIEDISSGTLHGKLQQFGWWNNSCSECGWDVRPSGKPVNFSA